MIQYYYTKKEWGVVMEKEELKILEELRRILNSKNEAIVILNNYFKGGVGKSKLSTMFAYLTDKFNLKVLMIDKDLQATLTKDLAKTFKVELPRVNFYEGLKNGNLASSIVHLTDNLDLIPGTFDLMLLPLEVLDEYFTWDKLVKLLLDKDNRVTNIPVPTDEDYYIEHPTARSFDDCCNEFWNTVTYVVKGLCRKEILFAIDHLNNIVRMELLRMISWKVGIEQGYSFSLGKNYKFLERYISPELWKKILATYNMGSYTEMWKSLELCMGIFRMVSKEVAQCLNYLYPDYDKNISNYVIRQKEKYQR